MDRRRRTLEILILLTTALTHYAVSATKVCEKAEPPQAIEMPLAIGHLPISSQAWENASEGAQTEALTNAASGFADRAPAWSLAVASSTLGLWQASLGAEDARFAAASITKSMTAVLVFKAIEAGQLTLSDTLDQWFPELPMAEQITIELLLTHRSGYVIPATGPLTGPYQPPEEDFRKLKEMGLAFCPGQGWAYSNVAYQLLGRILERVSGSTYADLISTHITTPLALTETAAIMPEMADPQLIQGHHGGQAVDQVDYASAFAAGAVESTAPDLLRYWQALLSGQLIAKESLQRMIDPAWPMFGDAKMRYGAGIQVAEVEGPGVMLMHSGGITGFSATIAWLADHDVWVAVMTNERQVPAEAAMWALVRSLNEVRDTTSQASP